MTAWFSGTFFQTATPMPNACIQPSMQAGLVGYPNTTPESMSSCVIQPETVESAIASNTHVMHRAMPLTRQECVLVETTKALAGTPQLPTLTASQGDMCTTCRSVAC